MSTLNQAAIILHSLPRAQSARILSRLEATEIRVVLDAVGRIDEVSADEVSAALSDLSIASGVEPMQIPARDAGSNIGREAAGSSERATTEEPYDLNVRFAFIADASATHRIQLLRDEHPRNIATVLAHLPPGIASAIVHELDPMLRVSVLRRLCDTDLPPSDEISQLVYTLKLRYNKLVNQHFNRNGVEVAANVISCADPDTRQRLIEQIRSDDPEMARRISKSLFEFDDLMLLEDSQVKSLLRNTDTSLWAPALKNATFETRKKVLSNMAFAASRVLSEEISSISSVDSHIADRARQQIVAQVLKMFTRLPEMDPAPLTSFPGVVTH